MLRVKKNQDTEINTMQKKGRNVIFHYFNYAPAIPVIISLIMRENEPMSIQNDARAKRGGDRGRHEAKGNHCQKGN